MHAAGSSAAPQSSAKQTEKKIPSSEVEAAAAATKRAKRKCTDADLVYRCRCARMFVPFETKQAHWWKAEDSRPYAVPSVAGEWDVYAAHGSSSGDSDPGCCDPGNWYWTQQMKMVTELRGSLSLQPSITYPGSLCLADESRNVTLMGSLTLCESFCGNRYFFTPGLKPRGALASDTIPDLTTTMELYGTTDATFFNEHFKYETHKPPALSRSEGRLLVPVPEGWDQHDIIGHRAGPGQRWVAFVMEQYGGADFDLPALNRTEVVENGGYDPFDAKPEAVDASVPPLRVCKGDLRITVVWTDGCSDGWRCDEYSTSYFCRRNTALGSKQTEIDGLKEENERLNRQVDEATPHVAMPAAQDDGIQTDVVFASAPQEHITALQGLVQHIATGATEQLAASMKIKEEYREEEEFAQDTLTFTSLAIDKHQTEIEVLKARIGRLERQVEEAGLRPVK